MRHRCLPLAFLLFASLAAHADSFRYTVTDYTGTDVVFLSPSLVTATTTVPASQLPTCTLLSYTCLSLTLLKAPAYDDFQVLVNSVNGQGDVNFFFAPGTFSTVGYFQTNSGTNTGSLVISRVAATAVTPEPSGLVLLGTGLLAMLAFTQRRVFKTGVSWPSV